MGEHSNVNLKATVLGLIICFSLEAVGQNLLKIGIKAKDASAANYSPDNSFLAIANGNDIILYNSGNDTQIRTLEGHKKKVLDIAFDDKNEFMISTSLDKTIKLWVPKTGQLLKTFEGHSKEVISAQFVKGTNYIVSISEDMSFRLWDTASGQLVYTKTEHTKPLRDLAVSSDGKYAATAGGDKRIIVWDVQTGSVLHKIDGHTDWVRCLAISPDNKTLASGGDDKKVKLWELESGKLIQTFTNQKAWIYDLDFSGDAKYLASAADDRSLYFYEVSTGNVSLNLDDFKGGVLGIHFSPLGKEIAVVEQYNADVQIWDISSLNISPVFRFKDENDRTPPQIYVANPPNIQNDRVRFSGDIIDIRGSVIDESGVRRLRINGIETPLKDNGGFVINLPLVAGDNFVTMEVTDVNDNIALKKFIISRKDLVGSDYNAREANNYLFVVGINDYQYWPTLNNAVKDATDVAGTLIGQYDFDFSNVTIIKNEQATRSNIYKGLRSLITQVTTKDNLMIYFSGHGYFDELVNEGYWVPVDAKLSAVGDYLSNSDILKIIGNIESQHTFLVADACFSGSLFNETKRGYAENVEQYRSRWGLASGRLEVVSDGAVGNNSPFARNLISFLKSNDKDKIAVSELVQHVKMQVAEESDQTPIGNPLKGAGDEGGEFVFYKKN